MNTEVLGVALGWGLIILGNFVATPAVVTAGCYIGISNATKGVLGSMTD